MSLAQLKAYRRQARDLRITGDMLIRDQALEFAAGRRAVRHNISTSNKETKNQ